MRQARGAASPPAPRCPPAAQTYLKSEGAAGLDARANAKKSEWLANAAMALDKARVVRYDRKSGSLYTTDLGRIASHFYLKTVSIEGYQAAVSEHMSYAAILKMVSASTEFGHLIVREEELPELDVMARSTDYKGGGSRVAIKGGVENSAGKVNALLQSYISRVKPTNFALTSDMMYVSDNAGRLLRALFEWTLQRKWSSLSLALLDLCKCLELRMWYDDHPLRMFEDILGEANVNKLAAKGLYSLEILSEMTAGELGSLLDRPSRGKDVVMCLSAFPRFEMSAKVAPITGDILRVTVSLTPCFRWYDRVHGLSQRYHLIVEDQTTERIFHHETWVLTKKMVSPPKGASVRSDWRPPPITLAPFFQLYLSKIPGFEIFYIRLDSFEFIVFHPFQRRIMRFRYGSGYGCIV